MSWHAFAACAGLDPEMFFPARGDAEGVTVAKAICDTCIVRADCLRENVYEKDGIYGGTTGRQRRNMNKAALEPEFRCIECSRLFVRNNANHLVCSDDCRYRRRRRIQNESHNRTRS